MDKSLHANSKDSTNGTIWGLLVFHGHSFLLSDLPLQVVRTAMYFRVRFLDWILTCALRQVLSLPLTLVL